MEPRQHHNEIILEVVQSLSSLGRCLLVSTQEYHHYEKQSINIVT